MYQEAFFLPAPLGDRFCVFSPAAGKQEKGVLIYVHPFAEELNNTRRLAALQCRSLASAGYAVLQIDLLGCGDSAGDFGDATWSDWLNDVHLAYRWVKQRSNAPVWFWGLRAGCLVAAEAARSLPDPVNFLFWQPVMTGSLALQHFLRLAAASALLDGGGKGVVASLRGEIEAGRSVEVGGYTLSSELARPLDAALLTPPTFGRGIVLWFEVMQRENLEFSPAALAAHREWNAAGYQISEVLIRGPAYWQSVEAEIAPALLAVTLQSLESSHAVR